MSVKIRMKRIGAKNTPAFRIVVADSRSPRDGKCIEELGCYLPLKKGEQIPQKPTGPWSLVFCDTAIQPSQSLGGWLGLIRRPL